MPAVPGAGACAKLPRASAAPGAAACRAAAGPSAGESAPAKQPEILVIIIYVYCADSPTYVFENPLEILKFELV